MQKNKGKAILGVFLSLLLMLPPVWATAETAPEQTPFLKVLTNNDMTDSTTMVSPDGNTVFGADTDTPYAFTRLHSPAQTTFEKVGDLMYIYNSSNKYNARAYHYLDFTGMTGKLVLDWRSWTTSTGVLYKVFYTINDTAVNNSSSPSLRSGGGPTAETRWTLIFDLDQDTIAFYQDGVKTEPSTAFEVEGQLTEFALLQYFQGAESSGKAGVLDDVKIYHLPTGSGVQLVDGTATEPDKATVQFGLPIKPETVSITDANVAGVTESAEVVNGYEVALSGLDFAQSYEITATATAIDGTQQSQTLTGRVRDAKVAAETLGLYLGGYAESKTPLAGLAAGQISGAVKVINEPRTPFTGVLQLAIYDADNTMVGYSDAVAVNVEGGTEKVVEAKVDTTAIENLALCTYRIMLWDSLSGMNPYGTEKAVVEGFQAESKTDISQAEKKLLITAEGYAAEDAGKPVSIYAELETQQGKTTVYVGEVPLAEGGKTEVAIPALASGLYTIHMQAPQLAEKYTGTHRVLTDGDAENILTAINADAEDGEDILDIIKDNKLDEIFAFPPYDALPGTDQDADAGKRKACERVFAARDADGFATMTEFYQAVYTASVVTAFAEDLSDEALMRYAKEYDAYIGFSDYAGYQVFLAGDAAFQTAVLDRMENYTIQNKTDLARALAGGVVTQQVYSAKSYLQMEEYLTKSNDLLNLDFTGFAQVKTQVSMDMVNKDYQTDKALGDDFDRLVTLHSAPPQDGGVTGGGSLGGGGGLGGGYGGGTTVMVSPEEPEEEAPTQTQQPENPEKRYFTDLAGYEWAKESIHLLYEQGIINGKAEGIFAPGDNITRGEYAKLLVAAFRIAEAAYDGFTDVQRNDWFYPYVSAAYVGGIVQGMGDGTFGAEAAITRQDAAVIAWRLLGSPKGEGALTFTDSDSIDGYARDGVLALTELGILNGTGSGAFEPKENLSRAEAAKLIAELLSREVA